MPLPRVPWPQRMSVRPPSSGGGPAVRPGPTRGPVGARPPPRPGAPAPPGGAPGPPGPPRRGSGGPGAPRPAPRAARPAPTRRSRGWRAPPARRDEAAWRAEQCAFRRDEIRYEDPEEVGPPGQDADQCLAGLAHKGAEARYPDGVPERVRALVDRELALIRQLGYAHYFVTVHDIGAFARGQGILCQGRGSAEQAGARGPAPGAGEGAGRGGGGRQGRNRAGGQARRAAGGARRGGRWPYADWTR